MDDIKGKGMCVGFRLRECVFVRVKEKNGESERERDRQGQTDRE